MLENSICVDDDLLVGEILEQVIDLRKEEQEKVVEARTEDVVVEPDSEMQVLSRVTVKGVTAEIDDSIKPENIKLGATILGVAGNVAPDKPDQSKVVKPSVNKQVVRADTGYELESVEVEGVTSEIDGNIQAENIRYGVEILGVVGAMEQIDLNGATATESDVLAGKTFFSGNSELKTGTLTIGTKSVEIELPEIFNSGFEVYYYQVNKDVILLSGSDYVGIWIYHIKDNTIKQGYTAGYGWKSYTQITDNLVLIGAGSSPASTVVYDVETDEITTTGDSYVGTIIAHRMDDNRFFICGNISSVKGVSVFDIRTKKSTKIYNDGYAWAYCVKVGETWLMTANDSNAGVVTYTESAESATKIYDTGNWNNLIVIDDKCFISSSYMNGLLLYNDTNKMIITLTSTGFNWKYIYKVDNITFVSNGSSSYKGLFIVDNNTLTSIYDDGYGYQYFHKIKDRIVISGTTPKLALIYNSADNSVVAKTSTLLGNNLKNSVVLDDRMLLTSNNTSSSYLYIYYYSTDEIKPSSASGLFTDYDIFVPDGQNCYISSSVKDYINIKYYEYDSNSVILVGAKVEVKL